MKYEIELPDEFEQFFEYLETYFDVERKTYLENTIKSEIMSRNSDLKIFNPGPQKENLLKKIEIEIPDEKFNEFKLLCEKTNQPLQEKLQALIKNALNSAEIDNF